MDFIRRYWVFGLIIVMVALHAMIIVNVRKELTRIKTDESQAVDLGVFRFQSAGNKSSIYRMHLYAALQPSYSLRGRKVLEQQMAVLAQLIHQQLRLADQPWLADPIHTDLKHHLKQEISKSLNIDFLDELVITEWLELPASATSISATGGKLAQN